MDIHTPIENNVNSLLYLIHICDPLLPIGGFTHSYGLETYVQKGIVHDVASTGRYLKAFMLNNFLYNDLLAVRLAWEHTDNLNHDGICRLDRLLSVSKTPQEIRTASVKLGKRFVKVINTVLGENVFLNSYIGKIEERECAGHYSIMFGISSRLFNIEKNAVLSAVSYNVASTIINNCAKLVPISQKDGQEILFTSHDLLADVIKKADLLDENSIGTSCCGFDLRSMQHERLYTRLYIS